MTAALSIGSTWLNPPPVAPDTAPAPADLIGRAAAGDRRAQAVVIDQLQDPIYRFCFSMLGGPEPAREAAQETALRILQKLRSFSGNAALSTWALGIALNVCREMRRTKARRLPRLVEEAAGHAPEAEPAGHAVHNEQAQRLHTLLATLPDRQREAVALRYLEGLSVRETAEAMGVAEGTAKATVFQALRALRRRMNEGGLA